MTSAVVSVLMSVYNSSRFVRAVIESILGQTFRDFEFIIIDDCSTDNSVEIVRSYNDPRIRLIPLPENRGLSAALNYGIEQARGEYIARADYDDVPEVARLERQLGFLREHPDIVLLGTWNMVIDAEGRLRGRTEYPVSHEEIVEQLAKKNCFCHSSVIVRTDVVRERRGYRGFRISQDYDLWTRVAERYRVANLPEYLIRYRVLQRSLSRGANLKRQALESAMVGYLYVERRAGRSDPLDNIPFSEQATWIEQHAHLVRKQAKDKYRDGLALLMHYGLGERGTRRALAFCLRGIWNFPRERLFWQFLYYHGTSRAIQRLVHVVRNIFRVLYGDHG